MKRMICLLLAIMMCMSGLAGCQTGNSQGQSQATQQTNETTQAVEDDSMLSDSRKNTLYQHFSGSQEMYETMMNTVENTVMPSFDFDYLLPTGTTVQNANSSYLEARDLYRDTIHGTDFTRMMAAYTWYCGIFGADVSQCKFFTAPGKIRAEKAFREVNMDFTMTQEQKDILVESVQNALATPYACTPSQYTTAP